MAWTASRLKTSAGLAEAPHGPYRCSRVRRVSRVREARLELEIAAGQAGDPLWLLINLDRAADRRANMAAHLGHRGIAYRRVCAVDGRALPRDVAGIDRDLFLRCHGRTLMPGDVGCFLSHLSAMRCLLDTRARHAVVLEDDVELSSDMVGVVGTLCGPGAPDDWDVVKLERHRDGLVLPLRPLFGPYRLGAMATRMSGAAAYLINRRAAQTYLSHLLPMEVPFDHAYDRGWALNLRVRIVSPCPAWAFGSVNGTPSKIAHEPEKLTGLKKLPALNWRTKTEATRVASALMAYASSLLSRTNTPDAGAGLGT